MHQTKYVDFKMGASMTSSAFERKMDVTLFLHYIVSVFTLRLRKSKL